MVCELRSTSSRTPVNDSDRAEALLVALADHSEKLNECDEVLEGEFVAVQVVDGFCMNLLVDSKQGGNEGGRDG